MYLMVAENPNCLGDERVFAASGPKREVAQVLLDRPDGTTRWCDVTGVSGPDNFVIAAAQQVEDSAAGVAWLITGGDWGLRVRVTGTKHLWAIEDPAQWGVPFLVMDSSSDVVKFKDGQ